MRVARRRVAVVVLVAAASAASCVTPAAADPPAATAPSASTTTPPTTAPPTTAPTTTPPDPAADPADGTGTDPAAAPPADADEPSAPAPAVGTAVDPPATPSEPPPTGQGEIDQVSQAVPGEYIVTLRPADPDNPDNPADPAEVDRRADDLADDYGGEVLYTYEHSIEGFAVALDEADALALSQDPLVAAVEENGVVHAFGTQSDAPWNLDRIDQRDLPLDHTYTDRATGAGVNAYVIDSGLRTTHQDFSGRASIGTDTVGDGRNGADCSGHGTHVAGVLGGETWGAAKDVTLIGVRVLDCAAQGTNASVIAGIDWVTANHVAPAVANMSLGATNSTALDAAVQRSIDTGVPYVLAAGNSNLNACNVSPARVGDGITVGYTDSTDTRAAASNVGPCLDLFAPGVAITSDWYTDDTATQLADGSSGAAPLVAGVVARYLQDRPDATPAEVAQAVHDGATANHVTDPGTGSPNLLVHANLVPDGSVLTIVTDQSPDDPIDVPFTVCPVEDGPCQTVTLDDDHDPALPRVANVALPAGTAYTVTEGPLEGWDLIGLTCDQGTTDLAARQATVTLAADAHATCRFTNEAPVLTITTDAVPGSAQDFTVDVCGPDPGTCRTVILDDDNDPTRPASTRLVGIAPGGYDVTQAAVAGWDLTALTCLPGAPGDWVDRPSGHARVEIDPGEQITCLFVNTKQASLTVVADSDPDGPQDLAFTACTPTTDGSCAAGTSSSFSLDDDADPTLSDRVTFSRPPGQVRVTLDPPTDWGIDTLACTTAETVDVGRRRVIAELTAGEVTTCTFTVRQGSIAIVQDTAPDAGQDFSVHACPVVGPCQDIVLDDDTDNALPSATTLDGLAPGVWTLTQDEVAGHGLVGLTCTRGATDVAARQVTLVVLAGQRTTCTFLDRATTLTVVQDTQPDGPQDFTFSRCIAGAPCADVVLDDDTDAARARTEVAAGLAPGTYTLTQAPVAGWGLAQLTCDTGEVVDRGAQTATVELAAGEQTTCTFTDRATSLAVQLDAQPDDPHDVTVSACRAGGDCVDAVIDDDPADSARSSSARWDGLAAGDWTLTASRTARWGPTGLTCTSGEADAAAATVAVHLDPGEQVSCTLTERRTSLTLVQSTGPDDPQDFTFDVCPDDGGACTHVALDDDTDPALPSTVALPAAPGTYTVTQAAVDTWTVVTLTCDGGQVQLDQRRAEVTLALGEQRTCTFGTTQTTLTVVNDTEPNSAVDVLYTTCAGSGGAGGCHSFGLDDDADATLPREITDRALTPGLYTVTQDPVPGHALTRLFCTQGLTSLSTRTATLNIRPGDHPRCTFTVEPTRLYVSQDTQPNGPQDFAFTRCTGPTGAEECTPFVLDDDSASTDVPGNVDSRGLAATTYTVTQQPVAGFGLVSASCSGAGAVVDLARGAVTVDLDAGVMASCTFVNRPTTLTIVHDAQPNSSVDVSYQGCLPAFGPDACGVPFLLDDDTDPTLPASVTATGLAAATYTVTQSATAGLPLTDLTCTAGRVSLGARRATVTLEPGEQVTCTFVNASAAGTAGATLVIVQNTTPDDPQDFTFTGCTGPDGAQGCGPFRLDDDDDATLPRTVTYAVEPGTEYSITQAAVPGYGLTALTCSSGEVERGQRRVTLEPRPGEQVTCTFVVRATSLTIVQDTSPDGPQDFTFTGCSGPGGARGCGTFRLDDDTDATLPRTVTYAGLAADTYSVTQAEASGYGLTGLSCSSGQVSTARRRATLLLAPGDQVTCTFTARATTLKIVQDTSPNDAQDLTFDGCAVAGGAGACTTFALDDDTDATLPSSVTHAGIPSGTYAVTQRAIDGYGVTSLSCTKGDPVVGSRRVEVALEAGDQVTCTFTTTATTLTIVEDLSPNDAQDVDVTTCGPSPSTCVLSTLDDDSDATRSNKAVLGALGPGTYTAVAAPPTGWGLTGLTCTKGETDAPSGTATVTLAPGEQATCTFVHTRTSLTLVQDTVPNSGQDVALQACDASTCLDVALDDDTDATLPSTRTLAPLTPSTWTITQAAVPGYALDTLACTSGETDVGQRRAVVALAAGEQVTCTFTLRLTSLTVVVDSQPDDAQDFAFTRCGAGSCAGVTLDDDTDATLPSSAALTGAAAGTYTLTQDTLPTGWAVTAITCTTTESVDVTARRVTVDLAPGEQTTCTFVVSRSTLTVVVDTVVNAARDFPFTLCPTTGACTSFNLDDDSDATLTTTRTFPALAADRYTLTQGLTAGAPRLTIACTTAETPDLAARQVTVDLAPGEQTTCTFTNRLPSITIVQDTIPNDGQDFTYYFCQQFGCGVFVLDDDFFGSTPSAVSLGDLTTQTYVISQNPVGGYVLSSVSCTSAETVNLAGGRVTVTLSSWEQVTCTFINLPG